MGRSAASKFVEFRLFGEVHVNTACDSLGNKAPACVMTVNINGVGIARMAGDQNGMTSLSKESIFGLC